MTYAHLLVSNVEAMTHRRRRRGLPWMKIATLVMCSASVLYLVVRVFIA